MEMEIEEVDLTGTQCQPLPPAPPPEKLKQKRGPGFTCVFCDKHFSGTTSENIHIRRHVFEKPFNCHICDFSAAAVTDVTTHVRRTHGTYNVQCCDPNCNKVFKSDYAMYVHHKLVHLSHGLVGNVSCDICGKRFKQQGTLISHRRLHTGEKPFACQVCDRTFTQKSTLTTHFRVHTGEKRFQCRTCEKWFGTKQYLQVHQEKVMCQPPPIPYICRICGAKFFTKKKLQEHRKLAHNPASPNNNQEGIQNQGVAAVAGSGRQMGMHRARVQKVMKVVNVSRGKSYVIEVTHHL